MSARTSAPLPIGPSPANDGAVLLGGRYRLESLLGRGGMGEVWAARDMELGRAVAIKLLLRKLADHPEYVARFTREMKRVARLKHPSIPRVYTTGQGPDGRLYMVMELVPGVTLRRMIRTQKRLDTVTAVCIAIQVAEVLGVAHVAKIRHRDVKPENVMVDDGGDASLLDFGIAQGDESESSTGDEGMDRPRLKGSSRLGTLGYVPPELALHQPVDHRGDFYQLGVTLYEMLTGRKPYEVAEDDVSGVLAAHAYERPRPIRELVPECPESLCAIVDRLLAKNPDDRYGKADNLLRDLRATFRESAPPGHPMASRLAQDRNDQARKRAFARRQSEAGPSEPPESMARPVRAAPVPEPPANHTEPLSWPVQPHASPATGAAAGVGERRTLELAPGYVAKSPAYAAQAGGRKTVAIPRDQVRKGPTYAGAIGALPPPARPILANGAPPGSLNLPMLITLVVLGVVCLSGMTVALWLTWQTRKMTLTMAAAVPTATTGAPASSSTAAASGAPAVPSATTSASAPPPPARALRVPEEGPVF
jgi:serine/threonine-protein kinase